MEKRPILHCTFVRVQSLTILHSHYLFGRVVLQPILCFRLWLQSQRRSSFIDIRAVVYDADVTHYR